MVQDPALKKYESNQDVVSHDWTIKTEGDEVVGIFVLSRFHFVLDGPAMEVWKYFKDWNLWIHDLHFSAVLGESEGKMVTMGINEKFHEHFRLKYPGMDPKGFQKYLLIKKAMPGKFFAKEALSKDGRAVESYYIY